MTATNGDPSASHIVLDGSPLTLDLLAPFLDVPFKVYVTPQTWQRLDYAAQATSMAAASTAAVYGINTGFGHLCQQKIPRDQLDQLQHNLIVSHAVGVGPDVAPSIVRLMLLLKIHALLQAASGVSKTVVDRLVLLLNEDCLPRVPTQGSLGASGDLAPLAHLALPLLGLGEVCLKGEAISTAQAYERLQLQPLTLGPKEGLALVNGTQFMLAYAVLIACRSRQLVRSADMIACQSLEAAAGSLRPFDPRLHRLRPHRGAIAVAENFMRMMQRSQILQSHVNCNRVQDPYSLRCIPQVHGATRDCLRHACEVIETEMNSVTDNPVVVDGGEIISGGLFHGQPLALVLDYLAMGLSELASISERRVYLLLSGIGGLPVLLTADPGINSGMMLLQYTAAALVSENKGLCMPACVDSIPTSLGQEDHVSMGARSAVKCLQVLENAETVLAIEQLCAAQGLDFRAPLRAGLGPQAAYEWFRRHVPHLDKDRPLGKEIQTSLSMLRSNAGLEEVRQAVGPLY